MSECDYCDFRENWYGKELKPVQSLLAVYLGQGRLNVATDDAAMAFPVNYCPMCGRKLEAEG